MQLRFKVSLFLCFLVFFLPGYVWGGWWIVERSEDRFGNFSSQSLFIQGQKMRVENPTSVFIFNLETDEISLVFSKQMIFWSGKSDSLKQKFLYKVEHQMRMMIEQIPLYEREKALPELERMLAELKSGEVDSLLLQKFTFAAVDSTLTIAAHAARKYQVSYDSAVIEEVWITHDIQPYAGISLVNLNQMMRLFSRPTVFSAARECKGWLDIMHDGLMMKSAVYTALGQSTSQVMQVKEVKVRDEFFMPPPDYKAVSADEITGIMLGDDKATNLRKATTDEVWKPLLPPAPRKPAQNQAPATIPPDITE